MANYNSRRAGPSLVNRQTNPHAERSHPRSSIVLPQRAEGRRVTQGQTRVLSSTIDPPPTRTSTSRHCAACEASALANSQRTRPTRGVDSGTTRVIPPSIRPSQSAPRVPAPRTSARTVPTPRRAVANGARARTGPAPSNVDPISRTSARTLARSTTQTLAQLLIRQGSLSRQVVLSHIPLVRYIPLPDDINHALSEQQHGHWVDTWVGSSLPSIPLEENRAGCLVCMMDFEEPRRRPLASELDEDNDALQEPHEAPEPLRLLPCEHVFQCTSF